MLVDYVPAYSFPEANYLATKYVKQIEQGFPTPALIFCLSPIVLQLFHGVLVAGEAAFLGAGEAPGLVSVMAPGFITAVPP